MRVTLILFALISVAPVWAATPCEIKGAAVHWAYDACMSRYETDDALHPGVMACGDRAQFLISSYGECKAKRVFKDRICVLAERTGSGQGSRQACMRDPGVVGATVRNGGI